MLFKSSQSSNRAHFIQEDVLQYSILSQLWHSKHRKRCAEEEVSVSFVRISTHPVSIIVWGWGHFIHISSSPSSSSFFFSIKVAAEHLKPTSSQDNHTGNMLLAYASTPPDERKKKLYFQELNLCRFLDCCKQSYSGNRWLSGKLWHFLL